MAVNHLALAYRQGSTFARFPFSHSSLTLFYTHNILLCCTVAVLCCQAFARQCALAPFNWRRLKLSKWILGAFAKTNTLWFACWELLHKNIKRRRTCFATALVCNKETHNSICEGFIIMELIVNNYRNIVVILTFIYIFSIFYFSLQIICTFWLFSSNLSSFIQSLTWTKRTLTVLFSVSVLLLWHLSIN